MPETLPPLASQDDLSVRLAVAFGRAAEESATRGAQAALVRQGELMWVGSYGLAHVETATPVDDRTVFCLASLGKTLLAALALHLVESGVLVLDAPLATVAGDDIPGAHTVTLRMLLSHTAGYPDLYETPEVQSLMPPDPTAASDTAYDPDRPFTWEMLLPGILEPVEPGEHWEYSNTGYIVLSEVLTRALGGEQGFHQAWSSFVGAAGDRYELTPDLLTFERSTLDLSRLAHGYDQQDDGSFVDAYAANPASGVPADLFGLPFGDGLFAGTAAGVAIFLDALFVQQRMLGQETLGQMTATTVAAAAAEVPDPDLSTYGMGTVRMATPGGEWQGHRGRYAGFSTIGGSHLETDTTLVVLTNSLTEAIPAVGIWRELVATV
jgi:D-alanyl-D-alanine carboxypeptidase